MIRHFTFSRDPGVESDDDDDIVEDDMFKVRIKRLHCRKLTHRLHLRICLYICMYKIIVHVGTSAVHGENT